MNADNKNNITLTVYDLPGDIVLYQQLRLINPHASFTIHGIDKLPKGDYTILIKWDSGKIISKLFTKL